ncbi:hypothetical protein LshimejAT787_1203810 [Lyophyllum shimeji]|uniref:Uncharacterized protein n=1 Tax=Lyophyllum shimeji TaxID=47721 RepID=A0A9P3PX89_LYOSH|nr:hypothetical protein LshimejAT787_1203810 [Lyophyllum shimeji]
MSSLNSHQALLLRCDRDGTIYACHLTTLSSLVRFIEWARAKRDALRFTIMKSFRKCSIPPISLIARNRHHLQSLRTRLRPRMAIHSSRANLTYLRSLHVKSESVSIDVKSQPFKLNFECSAGVARPVARHEIKVYLHSCWEARLQRKSPSLLKQGR